MKIAIIKPHILKHIFHPFDYVICMIFHIKKITCNFPNLQNKYK